MAVVVLYSLKIHALVVNSQGVSSPIKFNRQQSQSFCPRQMYIMAVDITSTCELLAKQHPTNPTRLMFPTSPIDSAHLKTVHPLLLTHPVQASYTSH